MWKGRSGEGGGRSWKGLSGCCGPWGPRGDAGPTVGVSATFYCEQKAQRWSLGSHTLRTGGCNRAAARLWSQPGSVHRRDGPSRLGCSVCGAGSAGGASSRRRSSCCSVAKSRLTLCDPQGLKHARCLCSSLSWGVCSNSCPSSHVSCPHGAGGSV